MRISKMFVIVITRMTTIVLAMPFGVGDLNLTHAAGPPLTAKQFPALSRTLHDEATKKAAPTPNDKVVGTLTINGKATRLKYVYARRRTAPPPVSVSLYCNEGDSEDVIDVIITNQPLTEDTLTSIQEDKYHGTDKIRGINLIIKSSGEHKWITYFLFQSGIVRPSGMTTYRGNPQFHAGRITGQIEYRTYGMDVITYSVSFDVLLKL